MNELTYNSRRLAAAITLTAFALSAQAASLSDKDKQFLAGYDKIYTALAADDLSGAKGAAKNLGEKGSDIAKVALKDARASFEKLSNRATTLFTGQSDYYVVHCPMLKNDWVQTSEKIANPYAGKDAHLRRD